MSYIKDNYQTTNQFFKDVKNGMNNIGLRLDDLESRREEVLGGGIQQVLDEEPEETIPPFYNGAFLVSGAADSDGVFRASCFDGQSRANNVAGYVIAGNQRIGVTASANLTLSDGGRVYLVGTPDIARHSATYKIQITSNDSNPSVTGSKWYTQLAYMSSGTIYQTQFGDVVAPWEVPAASNGGVQRIIAGDNVTIAPTTGKGSVTVNATGGGPTPVVSGGIAFPDYAALTGTGGITIQPSTNTSSSYAGYTATQDGWLRISIKNEAGYSDGCFKLLLNSSSVDIGMFQYQHKAGGMTAIIPIQAGTQIAYTAPTTDNFVVFAPSIGDGIPYPAYGNLGTGSGGTVVTSDGIVTSAHGWLRASIRNEGATTGCVVLNIGGNELRLFQCRTSAGGVTQLYPIQAGTSISYTAPSGCNCFFKFDH